MTLVEKLVRCSSVSGNEAEAVDLLIKEMELMGFKTRSDTIGNAIGISGRGPINIFLIGHIDTVAGEIPIKIEGNKLYGRGSVDAKGCLAAFTEAASRFNKSKKITVTVVGCVGEETDSRGAYSFMKESFVPNYVVIGEPSGWNGITLGYRGSQQLTYSHQASRHHHGAPEPTPAECAVDYYQNLSKIFAKKTPRFDETSLRLVDIQTYQDEGDIGVLMRLDLRTPLGFNHTIFAQECERYLPHGAKITTTDPLHAVIMDKKNVLVRSFLRTIRNFDGRPTFKKKTGTADMNIFAEWECPIIAYGPGDSSLDHTNQEHLDLNEYEKAINILVAALKYLEKSTNL
tara:strand:+ start:15821 stop:16852 length:1032 start_codon:yes stop_codon:yes gene_type:complete